MDWVLVDRDKHSVILKLQEFLVYLVGLEYLVDLVFLVDLGYYINIKFGCCKKNQLKLFKIPKIIKSITAVLYECNIYTVYGSYINTMELFIQLYFIYHYTYLKI